ncbi:MAG: type 1 pili tip component [Porticoccaceae bacterium]
MSQPGIRKDFFELLSEWEKRSVDSSKLTTTPTLVRTKDLVKLQALSNLYRLPAEEIAGELLHKALIALEEEMPYVQGDKVIRLEEGDEVYEDIGPLPRYLDAQKKVLENGES